MKTYTVNRLWNKLASVRDYVVSDCLENSQDLKIVLKDSDAFMTIPSHELEQRMFQAHKTKMKSKFDGKEYTLIDFGWMPDTH